MIPYVSKPRGQVRVRATCPDGHVTEATSDPGRVTWEGTCSTEGCEHPVKGRRVPRDVRPAQDPAAQPAPADDPHTVIEVPAYRDDPGPSFDEPQPEDEPASEPAPVRQPDPAAERPSEPPGPERPHRARLRNRLAARRDAGADEPREWIIPGVLGR